MIQVCGEERWAEVPNALVKRLQSIIRSLPVDTLATQITQPPPEAHIISDPNPRSALNTSLNSSQISYQDHRGQQPSGAPSNSSLHRPPSGLKADMSTTQHRVLFLAKQGGDYRLAQICVSNMTCHTFFSTMKMEYFRLRGVLRGWFSVWRYSHCDFYKVSVFILYLRMGFKSKACSSSSSMTTSSRSEAKIHSPTMRIPITSINQDQWTTFRQSQSTSSRNVSTPVTIHDHYFTCTMNVEGWGHIPLTS